MKSDPIDTSLECLVNYLREQNLNDEVFNSTAYVPLTDACLRRISSERDLLYMKAYQKYEKKSDFDNYFECFIERIRNLEDFKDLLMKKKAVESIKLTWKAKLNPKNWLPGKKKKAIKETEAALDVIEFDNLFICEYEEKVEQSFEALHGNQNLSEGLECMKKFYHRSTDAHNCGEALTRSNGEITEAFKPIYAHKRKSFRKCVAADLSVEESFLPAYNAKTSELSKENAKKVYVEETMKMFKKIVDLCRKK